MPLRTLSRLALHLALVVLMSLAGAMASAAAVNEAVASIPAATTPMKMPCDGMGTKQQVPAGDPCASGHCSLAACLGVAACLPDIPRMAALVPASGRIDAVDVSFVPAGVIDTPLRPPIA